MNDQEIIDTVFDWWSSNGKPCCEAVYQSDTLQVSWLEVGVRILELLEESR